MSRIFNYHRINYIRIFHYTTYTVAIVVLLMLIQDMGREPRAPEFDKAVSANSEGLKWCWQRTYRDFYYQVTFQGVQHKQYGRCYEYEGHIAPGFYDLTVSAVGFLNYVSEPRSEIGVAVDIEKLKSLENSLPVLNISTYSTEIPDEPKVAARLEIISDAGDVQRYRVGIELRGQSSMGYLKKQYGLEIRDKKNKDLSVAVLNLPANSDWVLHGPFSDKSLLRNHFAYYLARSIGLPAPQSQLVEVIVDSNHNDEALDYKGVYLLVEKIKRSDSLLPLQKLHRSMESVPAISGGYLLEITRWTKLRDGDVVYVLGEKPDSGRPKVWVLKYPKLKKLNKAQQNWITSYFKEVIRLAAEKDAQLFELIDINSFVDYWILQEVLQNADAFFASTYFYKDRNQPLKAGPVWDFNFSIGDRWGAQPSDTIKCSHWMSRHDNRALSPDLLQMPIFRQQIWQRWQQLKVSHLSAENMHTILDTMVLGLTKAQHKNFTRWPLFGANYSQSPTLYNMHSSSYGQEIERIKKMLSCRVAWLDKKIDAMSAL